MRPSAAAQCRKSAALPASALQQAPSGSLQDPVAADGTSPLRQALQEALQTDQLAAASAGVHDSPGKAGQHDTRSSSEATLDADQMHAADQHEAAVAAAADGSTAPMTSHQPDGSTAPLCSPHPSSSTAPLCSPQPSSSTLHQPAEQEVGDAGSPSSGLSAADIERILGPEYVPKSMKRKRKPAAAAPAQPSGPTGKLAKRKRAPKPAVPKPPRAASVTPSADGSAETQRPAARAGQSRKAAKRPSKALKFSSARTRPFEQQGAEDGPSAAEAPEPASPRKHAKMAAAYCAPEVVSSMPCVTERQAELRLSSACQHSLGC